MYSIMFAFTVQHIDMLNPLISRVPNCGNAIYSWYIHVSVYE